MSSKHFASTNNRNDLYTRVTQSIVTALEQGVRPWLKPWSERPSAGSITRPLRHNGERYRGINVLILWAEAHDKGYASPTWMTFRQALELKAHVRKGEHATHVVYADHFKRAETDDHGEEILREIPFLKVYAVFNADQIEGLPETFHTKPTPPMTLGSGPGQRITGADRFITSTGADIRHGGDTACYAIDADRIQLPHFETFRDAASYYATALHELTHWTRHPTRLARDLGRQRFGDEGYAREELVAELGAAFLCADLAIEASARDDHAAYIHAWLKVLRSDPRAIFEAAAHAQRAAEYLNGRQVQNT